jgi:uncharacterized membrane protein YphA (DoxX/SURF4 family)
MFADLLKSKESLAALILRAGLAAIFIVHGYIKTVVDIELAPNAISMTMQRVVGWLELLSGLLLLGGLCTRIAASLVIVLQLGAIILVSGRYAMDGVRVSREGANYMLVGPEYNLVLIAMCLCLLVLGAGVASLDRVIANARAGAKPAAAPTPTDAPPTPAAPTAVPAPAPGAPTNADKPAGSVPAA